MSNIFHTVAKRLILLAMVLVSAVSVSCYAGVKVDDLRCEYLKNPLAIDNTHPHFSWKMTSKENGAHSTAYQILVATELNKLNEKDADLWNSGKVEDEVSSGIRYEGTELSSRSHAFWKVRVWSENGQPSGWSKPASFGVGLLSETDWDEAAEFIAIEQPYENKKKQISPIFRKSFDYTPGKGRVLLHVNSLGYHDAYINGRPVTTSVLNPAVSQHPKRSIINTYDVTDLLKKGDNELVIWAGIGWYLKRIPGVIPGGPYVRAQLEKTGAGTHEVLARTDSTWEAAQVGRYYNGNKWTNGETVDMRESVNDFSAKSLAAVQWQPVVIGDIPAHNATPQMCEPNVFYQALAGINPDEDQPGYKNIIIRPQVIDAITWVKATKDTPYGQLRVKWEKVDGRFVIEVKVPVGSTATVYMPDGESKNLVSGNHTLECNL